MKFTINDITYEVRALSGWDMRLYDSLAMDIVRILSEALGVNYKSADDAPHTIVGTYDYFVKFCLSTTSNLGIFTDYNIAALVHINEAYQEFLLLFQEPGFYEAWLEAYTTVNKEKTTDQKKD